MPNKVIALVFAHNGDNEYEQTASTGTKRLLRKANAALTAHYGHRVGTVFGDPRGKSPTGDDVLSYAVCMTTPAEDVPWLLKTFWDQDSAGYVEVAPNVGYHNTSRGRARFFALDVSKGDEGANHYLADAPKSIMAKHYIAHIEDRQEDFDKAIDWLGKQFDIA